MPGLRLMAVDADDLQILSAHCQDAALTVGDCRFLPAERRFVVSMNRFAWERAAAPPARGGLLARLRPAPPPADERRRAVLHFDRVLAARRQGSIFRDAEAVLALLAIRFEPAEAPSGTVELVFAGGSAIRLDVEVIEAQLTDVGGAWAASSRPDHDRPA